MPKPMSVVGPTTVVEAQRRFFLQYVLLSDAERYARESVEEAIKEVRGAAKGEPINDAVQAGVDAMEDGGRGPTARIVLSLAGLNRMNPRPSVDGRHKDVILDNSIAPELFRIVPK